MSNKIDELLKLISGAKIKVDISDLPEILEQVAEIITTLRAQQLFLIKYLAVVTGKPIEILTAEYFDDFLEKELADALSKFLSERGQNRCHQN